MSDAKVKCSNCGAELTNLTFGWGKRQWLWGLLSFIPAMAILVWWQLWMFRSNQDFITDIQVSLIETKVAKDGLNVLGQLKNEGGHTWDSVTVEAEIYDKDGKFLDETSGYISAVLPPGSEENFRLTLTSSDEKILAAPKVVLKITDAEEDRF
jgi:hypothetical protein